MSHLLVSLLGSPRLERDGEPIIVDRRKAIALMAYLAVMRQRQSRDTLATLLWPEGDQSHARAALRCTLSKLNKALAGKWLEIDRESVGLDQRSAVQVDSETFSRCLVRSCAGHSRDGQEHRGVIFFDDVHWADGASLDLLLYLVRRIHQHPVCLIIRWRCRQAASDARLLHRRIAEALMSHTRGQRESGILAGQIAYHYQMAGNEGAAAEYYTLAGEQARVVCQRGGSGARAPCCYVPCSNYAGNLLQKRSNAAVTWLCVSSSVPLLSMTSSTRDSLAATEGCARRRARPSSSPR